MAITKEVYTKKNGIITERFRLRLDKKNLKINKSFKSIDDAEKFLLHFTEKNNLEENLKHLSQKEKKKEILKKIAIEKNELAKEELYMELYKATINLQDFFNQLGLINNTENFYKFKKIFKKHNFIHSKTKRNQKINYQDEMFIENSPYSRSTVKRVLIREKIMPYKCSSCSNEGEWNGKLLILQLEHKNGLGNDNRLENLDFLCPNCHSQTFTFAARNKNTINFDRKESPLETFRRKNHLSSNKLTKINECHLYAKSKEGQCLSKVYHNTFTKMEWKCSNPEHSSWFSDWEHTVKRQRWCPECNGGVRNKNGLQIAKEHALSKNGKCISTEYINCDTKMEWKCSVLEHPSWNSTYYSVINMETWCPKCYKDKEKNKLIETNYKQNKKPKLNIGIEKNTVNNKVTPEKFKKFLERAKNYATKKNGHCLSDYMPKERAKLTWKCNYDSHSTWNDTYSNVINNNKWCPDCEKLKKISF